MISLGRIDAIYEQMNSYVLELGDPAVVGPRYFIDKIAVCRNHLNAVSLVVSELSREKLVYSSDLRKAEALYELEAARLLSTDERVRGMANIKDRESMVTHILHAQRERISGLKDHLHSIDAVSKVVSHRSRELHATMDAIKNQRRFMQIEVQTGAFYGDERIPEHESVGMGPAGVILDFNEKELQGLLTEQEPPALPPAPNHEAVQEVPGIAEALDEVALEKAPAEAVQIDEDAALQRFLEGPIQEKAPVTVEPSPSASQGEEDLSYLLDTI